ncbi:YeiH family protein [Lonsdalea quercina]|uniref:YeiH family protein n=1 Tax=Lonsdalea quercina TaxID=71657 RepID=UPI0039770DE8
MQIFLARLRAVPATFTAQQRLPGILAIGLISLAVLWLADLPAISRWGLGSLTLAILLGMVLGNTLYPWVQASCDAGVQWTKHHLLRLGIVLYGFKLSVVQIAAIGPRGLMIDILTVSSTLLLACWLGRRWFKLDTQTVLLVGAGSSICGAAAVLATAPVLKANADKVAVAVSTVVIFGTTAMFVYPWFFAHFPFSHIVPFTAQTFGVYIGSTLHEVAQVVAAGHAINNEAESMAVIAKMLRVMMLAPFLFLLGLWLKRQRLAGVDAEESAPILFPWFAVVFILVAGFNSLSLLPVSWVNTLVKLDGMLLTMAMVALGIATRVQMLRQAGIKPVLLALLLFIWLIVGGGAINLGVMHLFS